MKNLKDTIIEKIKVDDIILNKEEFPIDGTIDDMIEFLKDYGFVKQKQGRGDAVHGNILDLDYFWRINKKTKDKLEWLNKVKKMRQVSEIDRNLIDEFISNIYVNEDRSIKIVFRFKEEYEDALKYLKNQNCMV